MRLLAVVSGEYGHRHADNLTETGPAHWSLEKWQAPAILPPIVDYPEDYVPADLPPADLILAFGENKGIAELIPDVARVTGARAVIAPVDSEAWLPRGLARQLRGWLADMGIVCVTPKPLCSLTPTDYSLTRRKRQAYDDALIAEFARYFGQPDLKLTIDPQSRTITAVDVSRDAVCGCARHVAEGLVGLSVDEAEQEGGMLHHHFPCLASMGIDVDYGDTLMHISGNILRDNIAGQVKPFKRIRYFKPGTRTD